MNNYSLSAWLVFLNTQQRKGYSAVNQLLDTMNDENLTEKERITETLRLLEEFGLYNSSNSHNDESSKGLDPMTEFVIDALWDTPGFGPEYVTRLFSVGIMNGVIWFERCLN